MCSGQRSRQASAPSPHPRPRPGAVHPPKRSCAWTGPGRQRQAVSVHVGGVTTSSSEGTLLCPPFVSWWGGGWVEGWVRGQRASGRVGACGGRGHGGACRLRWAHPPGPPGRLPEPRFCSRILPRSRPLRCSAPKCVSRVPRLLPGGLTHSAARGLVSRGGGGPWLSPARAEQGAGTWQSAVAEGGPGPAGRAPCWALSAWLSVGAAPGSVLGPAPKAQPSGGEMPRASLLTDGLGA